MQPRFYVYELARPDGRVFYVGKGTGRRIRRHESEARTICQCHKCNVIRKIWRDGGVVTYAIVLETDDESLAFQFEQERIAFHGRDVLVNHTDGGDGLRNPSMETRQRMMTAQQKRWKDPDAHKRQSESHRGKVPSERTRERLSQANSVRYHNPDERRATSERLKGRPVSEETREKIRAKVKQVWESAGHRERVSRAHSSDEARKKSSEVAKRLWADPKKRERLQAALKVARARREEKKKLQG